jgi:methylglutaconyl-CoA hydratase
VPAVGDPVRYQVQAGVATLTLDRPENRNALTPEMLDGIGESVGRAVADPAVRVVVVTNTPPVFCAGADLKGSRSRSDAPGAGPRHDLAAVLRSIQDSPKPVVARIAGHCMGGGVGLAAAADLSVAADDVLFGFTEVRVGVAPAVISVVCLPKMRRSDALELFLTGERITAERASQVGLITMSVPRMALDEAIATVVDALLAGAPGALAAAKTLVARVPGEDREVAFRWTAELSARLFASEEAAEGMAAFREKRSPSWRPRA